MPNTGPTREAAALMQATFDAIAAKDIETLSSFWHDDVVEDFMVIGPVVGKAAAAAFFVEMFTAMPDLVFATERVLPVDQSTAVGQWTLSGTFTGGPFQGIEPNGRTIQLQGIDVMEFEDGLLKHNTIYYDGLTWVRQLGMLPAAGSKADRAMLASFNAMTKVKGQLRRG